jgi:Protein of unknown function (DUF3617)
MRLLAMTGIAVLAVCAATADTLKDGMVQVKPGKYQWNQETNIMAIPIKEDNQECLIPEESKITLSKLARDLEEGCTVDNVRAIKGGYLFKLICAGKTTGTADATLIHTDKSMTIHAKGTANVGPIPAGFSMKASATYLGDCSPEEAAKAKANWLKDNPGAQ